ncbi:hypothetical protein EIN_197900 [Entamoeba invadens IP1]|uniref:Nucleotide exchange factor Fes1 domain-containing protein n=1 Tax=Entamoeba invadens IP1 TaxID=370355 RepID=A0A0A1TUQ5_ENTIV|nr:hypothetical protein EIN_197900 [Entamoeba invadens IP1]ELP83847.1 hypothetical protein EIN_197900 [Entamoeba invadens IP1]|eukprot:XP_004183193.1 hypothetical protein EIN_197900 [Entamoeba invadens IP1]
MADSHDNEQDKKVWAESMEKKVEFSNMNDGLLNFCLTHGFVGGDNKPRASKEDMEWLRKVFDGIESEAKMMFNILQECDKYLALKAKGVKPEKTEEEIGLGLEELVELVEDINNANDFVKMNGQYEMIKLLNEEKNERILENVWWVLKALVNNNPHAQKMLFEHKEFMQVFKKQFLSTDINSPVFFKIICFVCAFINENQSIQNEVGGEEFVVKYKEVLKNGDDKTKDRMKYTLNKFSDQQISSL